MQKVRWLDVRLIHRNLVKVASILKMFNEKELLIILEGLKLLKAEINYIKSDPNLLEIEKSLSLNPAEVSDLIDRLEQQINN